MCAARACCNVSLLQPQSCTTRNVPLSQRRCEASHLCGACPNSAAHVTSRRTAALLSILAWHVAQSVPAQAKPVISNKEVDDASSAFIQGLVEKSKANKEQYTKDRLNDYYRRNYKDYFSYEKGLGRSKNERGVSNENQQKILEWLKNNP